MRVAGQRFTAGHFTEEEYYKAPIENLRSYPVYYPGREPKGYWEFLNKVGPKPLIEPEKLKNEKDWIAAGRRVFEELDFPSSRTYDPERIRKIRSGSYVKERRIEALPDGTIASLRWAVTEKGVALEFGDCAGCHSRWIPGPSVGGKLYHGPGVNMPGPNLDFDLFPYADADYVPLGDSAYTNNKLTLAKGYRPTDADRRNPDVMLVSVGTDPGGALLTRKGTGFYKVPSLRGVWYRGHFLHDGSLVMLEELFDPARLNSDFQPKGWNPPGVTRRAVLGHEFGLSLTPDERRQLIAFLRTL
jgi:hypothetical protein